MLMKFTTGKRLVRTYLQNRLDELTGGTFTAALQKAEEKDGFLNVEFGRYLVNENDEVIGRQFSLRISKNEVTEGALLKQVDDTDYANVAVLLDLAYSNKGHLGYIPVKERDLRMCVPPDELTSVEGDQAINIPYLSKFYF